MAGISVTSSTVTTFKTFYRDHCIFFPAMLGWFVFSSLLSTYNKIVFGNDHLAFPCPLLMTSVHFFIQWGVAWVLSSIPMWAEPLGGNQIKDMPWLTFMKASLPCGIVTALDVGFSNLAIARISVTLYTMLKASSPIFVVASAFLFRLEPVTAGLILVVIIICCGEFLTVYGESEDTFDTLGAIFCLLASACSGLRWTIVQFFIQSIDPPLKSAIATMRLVSPCMFVFMLAFSFAIEHPIQTLGDGDSIFFNNARESITTVGMASMGGVLAVSMILCELFLIMKSSAIILMVGGVVKELCTICLGVLVFHDILNAINAMGFFIVFLGVMLYKLQFHIRKMQDKEEPVEEDEAVALDNVPLEDDNFHDDPSSIGDGNDDHANAAKKISLENRRAGTGKTRNCYYTSIEIDTRVADLS